MTAELLNAPPAIKDNEAFDPEDGRRIYLPTQEEIREMCQRIQSELSEEEFHQRSGGIYRPIASTVPRGALSTEYDPLFDKQ